MRINLQGFPIIILSHRRQEFLETCVDSITKHMSQVTNLIVVDDSGDSEHHQWLDDNGYEYVVVDPNENLGYLTAMNKVWSVAERETNFEGVPYAMLWEEDFVLTRDVSLYAMADVLSEHSNLAQLNLQRQPVYRVEKRLGYMESHARRGYNLHPNQSVGQAWVSRARPFTTNPGLIRRGVLLEPWPTREQCDTVQGGAEPAMSRVLERRGWRFGWYGAWNTPYTEHLGSEMKTGTGY